MTTNIRRPNRDALDDALSIYRDAMRPFIVKGLESVSGGKPLKDKVSDALGRSFLNELKKNNGDVESTIDVGDFVALISKFWNPPFRKAFKDRKNKVTDKLDCIRAARNFVMHPPTEDIGITDTIEWMDTISDVLSQIGCLDEQRRVENIRVGLILRPARLQPSSSLNETLDRMINRLNSGAIGGTSVIPWAAPIPSFGDPKSKVATLGLNPSPREFVDTFGEVLRGDSQRFHTLESLRLMSWATAGERHVQLIWDACRFYFSKNPYEWFEPLEKTISDAGFSYGAPFSNTCHFDLVPFATENTWGNLYPEQRSRLLNASKDTLGFLLRDSSVEVLILNGQDVVDEFQPIADNTLTVSSLDGSSATAYKGKISALSDVPLGRDVHVLGFSAYIQRATNQDATAIRQWITRSIAEMGDA